LGEWKENFFYDMNNGFYMRNDVSDNPEDPPLDAEGSGIYITTNNGQNWTLDNTPNPNLGKTNFPNRFYSFGNMVYFVQTGFGSSTFSRRKLNDSVCTYYDNIKTTGSIKINNQDYSTPNYHNLFGGIYPLFTEPIINENTINEKIFYKWFNGEMQSSIPEYGLFYDGKLSANYKTKFKSATANAISTASLTKSIRDTNGIINQVHESMDGFFYSRSTNNGTDFSREEIVNLGGSGNDNKNVNICEVKSDFSYPPVNSEDNVVAIWQIREGSNEAIKFARRNTTGQLHEWIRNTGHEFSVPSTNSFDLKAKVFVYQQCATCPANYFSLIAYLKPNGGSIDLRVRAKASDVGNNCDFLIASGNITDFAVVRTCLGPEQVLHFVYIIDNNVWYVCYKFSISGNDVSWGPDPNNPNTNNPNLYNPISDGDGSTNGRFSPDISIRNGRPIVSYKSLKAVQKYYNINNGDDWGVMSYYDNQIIAKYRYYNGGGINEPWSTFIPYGSGGHIQNNPSVVGCRNNNAFVIAYSYDNYYRVRTVLQGGPGYCNPSFFNANDVKIVRNSFYTTNNTFSNPSVMKLNYESPNYVITKDNFSVSNTPFQNQNSSEADNLVGVVREQNLNYYFDLGPVIAKNIVQNSSLTETAITNFMDFSHTMVTAPFYLAPFDTLIVGGNGYFSYDPNQQFLEKRFRVNLVRKSNNEVFRTLFYDTTHSEDTLESEYLRGFIFSDRELQSADSFFVQLLIDSSSFYQGDNTYYVYNVYSPDEIFDGGGDNPHSYKKKVFFQNGNNGHNQNLLPDAYSLSQNYPNPFNPVTNIKYQLPKDGFVTLKIFDITGREIANLVKEQKHAGFYTVSFNGSNFASGVYFYRIQSGDFTQVKKMVLIK
jgi:hypothetical protein